jgi:hypothetical protein
VEWVVQSLNPKISWKISPLCNEHHVKAEHEPKFNAEIKCLVLDMVKEKVRSDGKF